MRELKSYISEGFFSNIGANNRIKLAIDTIKDASLNDKIDLDSKRLEFANLLASILKDIETDIKKGKLVFEYTRNDRTCQNELVIISFKKSDSNDVEWIYSSVASKYGWSAYDIAHIITRDLYKEGAYPIKDLKLRHNISKTIKVTEFKVS